MKIFVAMSGGVDSSVAAALLKKQGFDVTGVFMRNWSPNEKERYYRRPCAWQEDRQMAMRAAAALDIPFLTFDFRKEYKKEVVDYMINSYRRGITPNPDVMCNKKIKFGLFLKKALQMGADYIATGHYVKIKDEKLFISKDKNKDQSYFLWPLTQKQLQYCLFPIGDYTKDEVRKLARRFGLPNADKKDSQGICFVGEINLKNFLKKYIKLKTGLIKTFDGKILSKHDGIYFYTIGQRHGLGVGGSAPYYVAKKDIKNNILYVAKGDRDKNLYMKEINIKEVRLFEGSRAFQMLARIRYRQPLQRCRVAGNKVIFSKPQRAVTSGQSIVFYKNGRLLGGGVII